MNKYTEILPQLRDCPECGSDEIKWCSISHRPYCECGNWGATNFGSDQDAIDSWNKKTQHEEYLEFKDENAALKARVAELELQCDKYKHSIQGTMLSSIKADAIREAVEACELRDLDQDMSGDWGISRHEILSIADKVERGES